MRLRVRGGGALRGKVRVPGDKSIGHRALLFAGLGRGASTLHGLSSGEDNLSTLAALEAMGVRAERGEALTIHGVGLRGLSMPKDVVDCGNSGTTMRLLAGLLSAQRFGTRLVGDASLTGRPMGRVVDPLRARGAHIGGSSKEGRPITEGKLYPPLSIAPLVEGEALAGIEYAMPVASAQVKSCLLLSGLYAAGPTSLQEPVVSRDHTERMMIALGVPLQTAGPAVHLDPSDWSGGWDAFEGTIPGDLSSAAFLLAAALMVPESRVVVEGVGVNPTRTGVLDVLRPMGAVVDLVPKPEGIRGEPTADLGVSHQALRGTLVGGELLVRMIDEVPVLCAMAAVANGTTEIRDAGELRVKETDRIAAMAKALQDFGVPCEELEDGMVIRGGGTLKAARVESHGDHRIAMSGALLGLCAEGETVIENAGCIATSFPTFVETLRALGARVEEDA
ncbi:MAG: 3-phosphoshikimate 1-carboxyvinyltransferase [Myxococcota bacterium]